MVDVPNIKIAYSRLIHTAKKDSMVKKKNPKKKKESLYLLRVPKRHLAPIIFTD